MTLKIDIASVPDRESWVAEVWNGDDLLAELFRDDRNAFIELYVPSGRNSVRLNLDEFLSAVMKARSELGT